MRVEEEVDYKGKRIQTFQNPDGQWIGKIEGTWEVKLTPSFEIGPDREKQKAAVLQLAKDAIDRGVFPPPNKK